jgi:alkanesulfonate monooxygenase SsuD/methylene tetrahydromethanopterin reductase-like flavin-dependent oxidoreductase (luciferase family)
MRCPADRFRSPDRIHVVKFAHFSQPFKRPDMSVRERHALLCRELALCDELGFDFAFGAEQHFTQILPSPAVYCAFGAAHTRRLRLGPMGYVVPFYDPIRIVEEAALLDNVLGGRLELGLVSGIIPGHFRIFHADWDNRRMLTNEAISLIKAVAASDGAFSFRGPFHEYTDVKLTLQPIQRPHPPLWLMSREPDELRLLAREGVHTGYLLFAPREEVGDRYREYLQVWKGAGHHHAPNVAYLTLVYVDESDEAAVATATPHLVHSLDAIYGSGFGGSILALADSYLKRGETGAAEIARNLTNAAYILGRQIVFVGSPATVIEQVRAAATEGCFNTLFSEFNIGTLPEADLMRSIRLFGTRVLPALREFQPVEFR